MLPLSNPGGGGEIICLEKDWVKILFNTCKSSISLFDYEGKNKEWIKIQSKYSLEGKHNEGFYLRKSRLQRNKKRGYHLRISEGLRVQLGHKLSRSCWGLNQGDVALLVHL